MAGSINTPAIFTGIWLDSSRTLLNKVQITTNTQTNSLIQLALGVALGLAAPALSDLLRRWYRWLQYLKWRYISKSSHQFINGEQTQLLLTDQPHEDEAIYTAPVARKANHGWKSYLPACCLYVIVSIGWAVAGGFATTLQTGSSGLSNSKTCGIWSLRNDASEKEMSDDDLLQTHKEIRAGQYVRDCYSTRLASTPNQCDFFNNKTIGYSYITKQECPFADKKFCAEGVSTAVRFTTGWVGGDVLGLNTVKAPQFNRTTICVPLDLSQGFAKQTPSQDLRFDYYLGFTNDSGYITDYTFRQFGDPFKWDVPAYAVSAYESSPYSELDYWHPIPALDRPHHTYMTVLFISSCRIVYKGPSEDYVFHANTPFLDTGRYWNPDPRARPIICIDWTELRSADGTISYIDQEDPKHSVEHEFVRSALRKSTTFQSIQFRLGTGLIAQESVGDFESLPLSNVQWILESEALFATSLARIQYDALDIAIGVGHEKDPGSYKEETAEWARGKLCWLYKFQLPHEYTNINLLATLGLSTLVLVLMFSTVETSVALADDKKSWFEGNMILFELVVGCILKPVRYLAGKVKKLWHGRKAQRTGL